MEPFLPLIGTALSGVMSLFGQNQTNQQNTANAADRYQVASADMTKAGLNPASMFGGGSAAQMPQIQSPMQGPANAAGNIMQALSTAKQMQQTDASIESIKAGIANTQADTANKAAANPFIAPRAKVDMANTTADTANKSVQNYVLKNQVSSSQFDAQTKAAGVPVAENAARTARNQLDMNGPFRSLLDQAGFAGRAADDVLSPVGSILNSAKSAKSLVGGLFRDNSRGMSAIPQAN